MNRLGDLVLVLDRTQRVTAAYGRWIQARRFKAAQFVGKNIGETWPRDVAAFHLAMNARALDGQVVLYDWEDPVPGSGHRMMTLLCPLYGAPHEGVIGIVRTSVEVDAAVRPTGAHAVQLALRHADTVPTADRGRRRGHPVTTAASASAPPMGPGKLHLSKRVQNLIFRLSARERHIVALLLDSARPAQIAGGLEISVHTVRQHLKHVLKKAGVHSQQELLDLLRGRRNFS